jgi:hypothetical protein
MAHDNLTVRWRKEAEDLLRRRGNYTLEQIHEEFEKDPARDALSLDLARRCYVTPVANHRYSVIWQMLPGQNVAEVSAVVPTRFVAGGDPQALKAQVKRVVSLETGGRVNLDF